MNREEALEHFRNHAVGELVEKAAIEFHKEFLKKRELFCRKMVEGLENMLQNIQESGEQTPIAYIQISYLQVHVIDGTYQWVIEAQDKNRYLDKKERMTVITMSEFFEAIERLEMELKKEVAKYVNNLYEGDIAEFKLEAFKKCLGCLYLAGSYALRDIRNHSLYQGLEKCKIFQIFFGGYMDQVQRLHLQTELQEDEMKKLFYVPGDIDQWKEEYFIYQDFSKIVLKEEGKRVDCKNFMFACFEKSRIRYHLFMLTNFIGVNFRESRIDDTGFIGNTFQQADFTGATLCNCDMHASLFYGGEFIDGKVTPGIYPVSFQNARLAHVNFSFADLRNCDFTNATLEDIVFDNAKMKGTKLPMEYQHKLNFTKEQIEEIVWVEE